jgi:branched-chain amino acid transport system permease protein
MNWRTGGLNNRALIGLGVFLVLGWGLSYLFPPVLATVVVLGLYFAIVASSFNLVYGSLGIFTLMQSVFAAVGGYTSVYLYNTFNITPWISLLIAPVVAAIIAFPVALAAVRAGTGAVLTALITLIVAQAAVPLLGAIEPLGGTVGLYLEVKPEPTFWDFQFISPNTYVQILLALNVIVLAFMIWWKGSRFGYFTTAIKDAPDAAASIGIPSGRLRIATIMVSAAIASVGGVVFAQYNLQVTPGLFLGEAGVFQVVVIALVGGVARSWGAIVAALIVVNLTNWFTDAANGAPGVPALVFAGVFVLIALALPRGISGAWDAANRRIRARRAITTSSALADEQSRPKVDA